jgi:hypothetical protein
MALLHVHQSDGDPILLLERDPLHLLHHDTYRDLASQAAGVEPSVVDNDDIDDDSAELFLHEGKLKDWNNQGLTRRTSSVSNEAQQRRDSFATKRVPSKNVDRHERVPSKNTDNHKRLASNNAEDHKRDASDNPDDRKLVHTTKGVDVRASEAIESIRVQYQALYREGNLFELSRVALTAEVEGFKTLHEIDFRQVRSPWPYYSCPRYGSPILQAIKYGVAASISCAETQRNSSFRRIFKSHSARRGLSY